MDRTEKSELVSEYRQLFTNSALVVVTHYTGMTVSEMTEPMKASVIATFSDAKK